MQCLLIDATSGWCHFPRSGTSLPHSTHLMVDIVIYVSHLVHVQLKKYSRRKWMEYSKEYSKEFVWWSSTFIAGSTKEKHDERLRATLNRARESRMKFNPKELQRCSTEVIFFEDCWPRMDESHIHVKWYQWEIWRHRRARKSCNVNSVCLHT